MEPNSYCKVGWGEHARSIATNCTQLMYQRQLVDVTLVADGYSFNAHRLVLSAISPYFRKMFTEMPAHQQAYVIMTDVSRQTMEHLIAYIYTGEVTVHKESLADLLVAAKSLDINGLSNGRTLRSFAKRHSNRFTSLTGNPSSTSNRYQSKRTLVEFRSTQTNQMKKSQPQHDNDDILIEPKQEQSEAVSCQQLLLNEENFDIVEYSLDVDACPSQGNSNYSDENINFDTELLEFLLNNDETLMNGLCDGQENDGSKPKAPEDVDGPQRKRAKRKFEISDYNLAADIRTEPNGIERLHHENFQYRKNGKCTKNNTQRWSCVKKDSIKCHATASTVQTDGVHMMKLMIVEHCHQP